MSGPDLGALLGLWLLCGGLVALLAALAQSPRVRAFGRRRRARLDARLRYLQLALHGRDLLRAQLLAAAALPALAVLGESVQPLLALPVVAIAPELWLERQAARRTARIEQQLDGWLVSLSNALRANPSLGEAIAASARLAGEPLRGELELALKETRLGAPLADALQDMARRVKSPVVSSAVVALRIAAHAGGNLNRTLETTAATLREMARLEGVVRTKTAEGRAQSGVIAAVPVGLFWMLGRLDPGLLAPLTQTAGGQLVLAGAGVLWLCALLWARRIVAVDI